jgi:hypothetical protein
MVFHMRLADTRLTLTAILQVCHLGALNFNRCVYIVDCLHVLPLLLVPTRLSRPLRPLAQRPTGGYRS